jgi:hypothetical protein
MQLEEEANTGVDIPTAYKLRFFRPIARKAVPGIALGSLSILNRRREWFVYNCLDKLIWWTVVVFTHIMKDHRWSSIHTPFIS